MALFMVTNQLTPMAEPNIGRDYHTEALLLPDGRVLVAGSDPLFDDQKNTIPGTFEQRIEIFTPPSPCRCRRRRTGCR